MSLQFQFLLITGEEALRKWQHGLRDVHTEVHLAVWQCATFPHDLQGAAHVDITPGLSFLPPKPTSIRTTAEATPQPWLFPLSPIHPRLQIPARCF